MNVARLPFLSAITRQTAFPVMVSVAFLVSSSEGAQGGKKNPASKVYVSDVSGDAQIDTGDTIHDVSKRSVYTAEGTVIETKAADPGAERGRNFSTMVYSNGTGAFFDADTRVEVKSFVQQPFTPNRSDIDVEPSVSQTQAYVARGAVGLCTSKLVAGSSMTYQTPHGSVNIRGRKVVVQADKDVTTISMLEGDSTVKAGAMDLGGHTIKAGEQAIIRQGAQGQPNSIKIQKIPEADTAALDDRVAMACMAKKTVYFEVREKKEDSNGQPGDEAEGANGPITAFDGNSADTDSRSNSRREIVAVTVIPVKPAVQHTMSVSTIPGQ